MSPLIILLAAGAAPSPQRPIPALIFKDDYPLAALNKGEEGPVLAELLVTPTGTVDNCRIVVSSNSELLDAATCRVIQKRARFRPATGSDNRPMYGIYRQVITWSIGTPRTATVEPDHQLTINRAPPGITMPVALKLSYVSKSDGSISACREADESSAASIRLAGLACQALSAQPAEIVRDHAGRPVDALNSTTVEFSVQP
jgi:TonB family protein